VKAWGHYYDFCSTSYILYNKLHFAYKLCQLTVCTHETPVIPVVVGRTKAGVINSKPLHQWPLESKWRPAPEVNSLITRPVLFTTINIKGLDLTKDLVFFVSLNCDTTIQRQHPLYLTCLLLPYRQSQVLKTWSTVHTVSSSTNVAACWFSCCTLPFGTVFPRLYAMRIVSL